FYPFLPRIRPPPPPTLFPYTTLFRSPIEWDVRAVHRDVTVEQGGDAPVLWPDDGPGTAPQDTVVHQEEIGTRGHAELNRCFAAVDRKSTRLNSSHVSISYAVFCLKKK